MVRRKAVTNVVATMLIFGIMITSVGVLYSQIAPTLLGYETSTSTTNQSFIFQSISNEAQKLSSAATGSVGRVHIISSQTRYDINTARTVTINVLDNGVSQVSDSIDTGEFKAYLSGSFQPRGLKFVNRVSSEASSLVNDTGDEYWVLTSDYTYSTGEFTMYFRGAISVHQLGATSWKISITQLKIDYLSSPLDGTPLAFPVELDEWTLRLRRQSSIVTSIAPFTVTGPVTVSHTVNTVAGTVYSFPSIQNGDTVEVDIITVPILFGI